MVGTGTPETLAANPPATPAATSPACCPPEPAPRPHHDRHLDRLRPQLEHLSPTHPGGPRPRRRPPGRGRPARRAARSPRRRPRPGQSRRLCCTSTPCCCSPPGATPALTGRWPNLGHLDEACQHRRSLRPARPRQLRPRAGLVLRRRHRPLTRLADDADASLGPRRGPRSPHPRRLTGRPPAAGGGFPGRPRRPRSRVAEGQARRRRRSRTPRPAGRLPADLGAVEHLPAIQRMVRRRPGGQQLRRPADIEADIQRSPARMPRRAAGRRPRPHRRRRPRKPPCGRLPRAAAGAAAAHPLGSLREPVKRDEPKVGRNDPAPCGSGRKYKKCHGAN